MTPKHYECQLTYELLRFSTFELQTVFTGKTFKDCLEELKNNADERLQTHFSIDVVVRDGDGVPMFRQSLFSLNAIDNNEVKYIDLYGRYGHCVYNENFKHKYWRGNENYSRPMELINYDGEQL